jgi:hypothetical protein
MENSDGVHSHLFQRLRPWQKAASLKKNVKIPEINSTWLCLKIVGTPLNLRVNHHFSK